MRWGRLAAKWKRSEIIETDRPQHPAGNPRARISRRVGAIVVGARVDHHGSAIHIEKATIAILQPSSANGIFHHAAAVGTDDEVGNIAEMRSLRVFAAVE